MARRRRTLPDGSQMTALERRMLQRLASGWTLSEVAHAERRTHSALSMRCIRLCQRIGLRTTAQLIAWTVENGYATWREESDSVPRHVGWQ